MTRKAYGLQCQLFAESDGLFKVPFSKKSPYYESVFWRQNSKDGTRFTAVLVCIRILSSILLNIDLNLAAGALWCFNFWMFACPDTTINRVWQQLWRNSYTTLAIIQKIDHWQLPASRDLTRLINYSIIWNYSHRRHERQKPQCTGSCLALHT